MSSNDVDRALAAPIESTGRLLLELDEDQWLERKSSRVGAKDVAIALVALANAEGGVLVVGLHDGRVEGTKSDVRKTNELRQAAIDHSVPPVPHRIEQASCVNDLGEVDTLLVFRVPPSESVHELKNGDCYLRVGDESRRLTFTQRQELHFDRGAQFDGTSIAGVKVGMLDTTLVRQYRDAAGFTGTDTQLLRNRGLLTGNGAVTAAGYLLFAEHPEQRFPSASVRVVRYRANDRGAGSRLTLDAGYDERVEGPIPRLIERAAALVDQWQPRRTALDASGRFADLPIVPRDAWLEGIVNAVVHRSYNLAGDHIRVEIFPNRIEITSPGRFPGLADPSRPLEIDRYARNPRIARVCTDLRITREFGEGIRRMFEEMRLQGLTDPSYTQGQASVRLALLGVSRIPQDVIDSLPRGAVATLRALRSAGTSLGTGEVQDLTGLARPTVIRHLTALRDESLVVWSGKSAKDPRATWTAVE
ncbi:ATP-binding protein [uncultured Amnibacterium sp.]|uniref:ATP-binding protein n=1 Tax=uncultured Amnibacterium sp. TaxID=1631851 RepID=UPI0035CC16B4